MDEMRPAWDAAVEIKAIALDEVYCLCVETYDTAPILDEDFINRIIPIIEYERNAKLRELRTWLRHAPGDFRTCDEWRRDVIEKIGSLING